MSTGIQHATNQSIQPFGSSEEYLYAMKEDLAEWLRDLYDIEIDVNNIFETLETGDVLCSHANNVTRVAGEFIEKFGTGLQVQLPTKGVTFVRSAQPATFLARDNVSNFINWCRMQMNIKDVLMFETDDLVLRKNEKNFVLCLLEVARRASRFGMAAPVLIQLEQEIEEEIEQEIQEELAKPPVDTPLPAKPQRRASNTQNLDEMVQHLISHCTCPAQFPMVKLSEGKYRVGDSSALIFVRILRNHVMVRVGGGWDTLEHYLDKHDPCRCTSVSHKLSQRAATPVHEIRGRLRPRPDGAGQTQQPAMLVLSRRAHPPPRPVLWTPSAPLSSTARGLASARAPRTADPRSRTPEPGPRDPRTPGRYTSSSLSPDPGPRDRLHTADPGPRDRLHTADPGPRDRLHTADLGPRDRLHTADPGPRSARELKAPSPSRLRQSTSTPTLQHPQSEKDYPACNSSTRTGREVKRSSRVPRLTSSLPRPIQRSSTPQPQSQPQPQPQRSKTPLVFHRTENRLTQTWTKSQFVSKLRQSSNSTESGGFSTSQMQGGPVTPRPVTPRPVTPRPATPRPVTPRPVTPVRGYSPARYTPACTRPASVGIREPEDDRVPQRSPNFIRTFCPAKKSWDIASGEAPVTPFTPIGGNLRGVQNKTPTPGGITANPSRACSNVNTDCRKPHGLSRQRAFGGPSDKTSTNSEVRGSFDELDFPDLPKLSGKGSGTGDGDSVTGYLFVPPPPISPAEEASLYRSLEHEILANLQQLSVDSGDDSDSNVPEDNSQNGLHDLRPKAPEQTCGEFQVESDRSKPRSLSQKQASSTDSMSVSRQSEASFDLVIGELSGGKSQLEKLCVESWVNTLPSTARSSDVASGSTEVHTGLNPSVISSWSSLGSSHQSIEQPAGPPDSGNRTSVSVSHRSTATNSTSVNLRADSADPENLMRLKPASFRQRRTLKKPERIPSMYKLRLRPRVRPRRDHRPGKKPSRIPTPLSYRDCGPMEEPGGAMTNTPSVTHRQAQPPSSHTQAQPPSSHTQAQPPSSHTQAQPPSSVKGYGQVHCCRQPGGFECAKRLEQSHMSSQETAGGPEQESWV